MYTEIKKTHKVKVEYWVKATADVCIDIYPTENEKLECEAIEQALKEEFEMQHGLIGENNIIDEFEIVDYQ